MAKHELCTSFFLSKLGFPLDGISTVTDFPIISMVGDDFIDFNGNNVFFEAQTCHAQGSCSSP